MLGSLLDSIPQFANLANLVLLNLGWWCTDYKCKTWYLPAGLAPSPFIDLSKYNQLLFNEVLASLWFSDMQMQGHEMGEEGGGGPSKKISGNNFALDSPRRLPTISFPPTNSDLRPLRPVEAPSLTRLALEEVK
jgi:hypothetical protein